MATRTFRFALPDPKAIEAEIQDRASMGTVTTVTKADIVATAATGTTDGKLVLSGTPGAGGDVLILIPLHGVPTTLDGKLLRPTRAGFSASKSTGATTTNKIASVGIYQSIPTAASATSTITLVGTADTTGWLLGAAAATIVDITATLDSTAVAEQGPLYLGIKVTVTTAAMAFNLHLTGHGWVEFDNIGVA